MYTKVYALEGNNAPVFPQHYPKSVLLGCVYVVDCLMVRTRGQPFPPFLLWAARYGCLQ